MIDQAPTELLLIRHAHVDTGTGEGRISGWLDLPLSAKGVRQLEAFTCDQRLGAPDALYTSTLQRAERTAEVLSRCWQLAARRDGELREIFCGDFEGQEISSVKLAHAAIWERNHAQRDDEFGWPGGESYRAFRARVTGAFSRIAEAHAGGCVAVVTHSGAITQVVGLLKGIPPSRWDHHRVGPFSGTRVVWLGNKPQQLLSFGVNEWWRAVPIPVS